MIGLLYRPLVRYSLKCGGREDFVSAGLAVPVPTFAKKLITFDAPGAGPANRNMRPGRSSVQFPLILPPFRRANSCALR